jgi:hypothetical protein
VIEGLMYEAYISLVNLIETDAQLLWNSQLPNEAYRPDIGTIINNADILKSRLISIENEPQEHIARMSFELMDKRIRTYLNRANERQP